MSSGSSAIQRATATEMLRYAVHRIEIRFQPGAKAELSPDTGEPLVDDDAPDYPPDGITFVSHCVTPSLVLYVVDRAERKLDLCDIDLSEACTDVLGIDFDAFTNGCRQLHKLNVSGCVELDDDSVSLIGERCPHLTDFNLNGCIAVTDASIAKLGGECYQLTSLSVAKCSRITPLGLNPVFRGCKALRELDLRELPNVNDSVLMTIGDCIPRLRVLRLSLALRVSDDGLAHLALAMEEGCIGAQRYESVPEAERGVELEVLELAGCQRVTDLGVIAIVQRCTRLTDLNLSAVELLTEKSLVSATHNCWNLTNLDISDIPAVKEAPFWFDDVNDGRPAVDRSMLKNLAELSLDNCLSASSRAFEGEWREKRARVCCLQLCCVRSRHFLLTVSLYLSLPSHY